MRGDRLPVGDLRDVVDDRHHPEERQAGGVEQRAPARRRQRRQERREAEHQRGQPDDPRAAEPLGQRPATRPPTIPPTAARVSTRPTPLGVRCSVRTMKGISTASSMELNRLLVPVQATTLRRIGCLTTKCRPSLTSSRIRAFPVAGMRRRLGRPDQQQRQRGQAVARGVGDQRPRRAERADQHAAERGPGELREGLRGPELAVAVDQLAPAPAAPGGSSGRRRRRTRSARRPAARRSADAGRSGAGRAAWPAAPRPSAAAGRGRTTSSAGAWPPGPRSTPAGSATSRNGSVLIAVSRPTWKVLTSSSTTAASGSASRVIALPISLTDCPPHRSRKSRCRHRERRGAEPVRMSVTP